MSEIRDLFNRSTVVKDLSTVVPGELILVGNNSDLYDFNGTVNIRLVRIASFNPGSTYILTEDNIMIHKDLHYFLRPLVGPLPRFRRFQKDTDNA